MIIKETDVVIIGAGLTGLTSAFYLKKRGRNLQILEQADRTGGQIRSFHSDGFVFESGPNTGVISYPEVAELFLNLASDCRLVTAFETAKRRYIWKGNRFHELPSGLFSALTTPLFSFTDKFRILSEPFRAKGNNPDEPIADMVCRRLGKSYLDYAVDPFLSGVYAGDAQKLITRYALPKLYNLEQKYGSFIRGAIAKAKQPKTGRDRLATRQVFSTEGGLDRLTSALTHRIGMDNITLSASGIRINPNEGKWEITFSSPQGQKTIWANRVITTTGAYSLSGLLPFIPEKEIKKMTDLSYAPIVQIAVGVNNIGNLAFNGFGGLVPTREKKDVLGILYPSACFAERAPEKGALFSFFIGGIQHRELTELSDTELETLVIRAFHSMLKFPSGIEPDLLRIFRHARAIPQYERSSGERLQIIEAVEKRYPGLYLAGNIREGIGMADRIKQATLLGNRI
ncbi:MAG: protoporphyrinogen oxidase [Massilibacteroides sp.]|nr:protoporphyrinogen oxidase [Massilibacteroides sp.]MDD3064340.1 protoporphyrinogen oxidase [Massilibacteroides sp.]MDD4114266.1 protoporphyrinogen oxidase [Massilibacteroides sp.]MDD4660363.1 protoporphyrinogen oxidase [Massilibacteroides sp.]